MRFSLVTLLGFAFFTACVLGLCLRPTKEVILTLPSLRHTWDDYSVPSISADGRLCCHITRSRTIQFYDLTSQKMITEWAYDPPNGLVIWSMRISLDNKWVILNNGSITSARPSKTTYLEIATGNIHTLPDGVIFPSDSDTSHSSDGSIQAIYVVTNHQAEVWRIRHWDMADSFMFLVALILFYAGLIHWIDQRPIDRKTSRS